MSDGTGPRPRVTVFMFVRNGAGSVRRAVDSVLAQTYPDIEFIVQDGASTDGTLEILAAYGERLNVVSQPDSGPSEGLLRALKRCTGDIIGSCLADEELLPDAIERAVAVLQREPDLGAITGDAIITDFAGVQTGFWKSGPFNLIDYLLCDYTPYFCASFFRRRALLEFGLEAGDWDTDCVEFDLWCRLATRARIEYVPGTWAKYASHAGQSSNDVRDVAVHFGGRLKRIVAMCSKGGFFGESPLLRTLFVRGHTRAFVNHAIGNHLPAIAETVHRLAREALAPFPPALLDGVPYDEKFGLPPAAQASEPRPSGRAGFRIRRLFGRGREPPPAEPQPALPPPIDDHLKARMYAELARHYEASQRFQEALEVWRAAAALNGLTGLDHPVPPLERPAYTPVQRS